MSSPPSDRTASWRTAALLGAAVWWLFDLVVLRTGVPDRLDDTWEYGLVARSLLEGHGFRTILIHPPLWGFRDALLSVPMAVHGPLLPVLLAPALALFGDRALDGIAWLGALGAIAAVIPLVRLGERCARVEVGFAAALLWTLAPFTQRAVHHDAALTVGAALILAAVELATRERPRFLAAGLALGCAALARHELVYPAPLLALSFGRRGLPMLAGLALCLVPLGVQRWMAFGQPFFNLSNYLLIGYWRGNWGDAPMRDFALTPDRFPGVVLAMLPELAAKLRDFFPHAVKRALLVPTPATGWLAVLGALFAVAAPRTRGNALRMAALAAIPVAVMTAVAYDERYLVPLLPLWALAAARGIFELASRGPAWAARPRAWIGMLLLLIAPTVAPQVREEIADARRCAVLLANERARVAEWMKRDTPADLPGSPRLAFSDTPDFLAWTSQRPVIWVTAAEYAALPVRDDGSGRPARSDPEAGYFHTDEPAMNR